MNVYARVPVLTTDGPLMVMVTAPEMPGISGRAVEIREPDLAGPVRPPLYLIADSIATRFGTSSGSGRRCRRIRRGVIAA
ncbi:MAG TPA: hypothetical protein VFS34_08420, partial [Thermoanaerobaculia bacterium]|nr:hypothetical protein [Thermoanaerobaculia bacterium]